MENETKNNTIELERKRQEKEFQEALAKAALSDGKEGEEEDGYWLRKAMELSMDSERDASPEQVARFKERLAVEVPRIQAEKRRSAQGENRFGKMARRVAMFVLLVAIVGGSTLGFASDAFAGGLSNFFSRLLEGGEELGLTEREDAGVEFDLADFEGMYLPTWIPEGYIVSEVDDVLGYKRITYKNKDGEIICFHIYSASQSVAVDNEDVEERAVFLHDSWGKIINRGDSIAIVWEDAEYIYMIMGSLEMQNDLQKVAECAEKVS